MSALVSTPKPPSIGFDTSEPTVRIELSLSVVAGASGWNRKRLRSAASSSSPRNAPDSVMAPRLPAGRRAGMRQQLGHLDHVVERVGADHADLARHRVEGLDRARERAGMRHRGLPAAFRLAELERDDVLAGGARHAGRRP